jgi:hypothetical protein
MPFVGSKLQAWPDADNARMGGWSGRVRPGMKWEDLGLGNRVASISTIKQVTTFDAHDFGKRRRKYIKTSQRRVYGRNGAYLIHPLDAPEQFIVFRHTRGQKKDKPIYHGITPRSWGQSAGKKFKFFVTARRHIYNWSDHTFKRLVQSGGYDKNMVEEIRMAYAKDY